MLIVVRFCYRNEFLTLMKGINNKLTANLPPALIVPWKQEANYFMDGHLFRLLELQSVHFCIQGMYSELFLK